MVVGDRGMKLTSLSNEIMESRQSSTINCCTRLLYPCGLKELDDIMNTLFRALHHQHVAHGRVQFQSGIRNLLMEPTGELQQGRSIFIMGFVARRCANSNPATSICAKARPHLNIPGKGDKTGIAADVHGFSGNAMRATVAANALEHEADIAKTQVWLGHANIATTRI